MKKSNNLAKRLMLCTEPVEVSSFKKKQLANKNSRLDNNKLRF